MPALTITAVDFTTDQLTIAGHGLLTGAGPAAVRGGLLPAPLTQVTDCWVIVVDANTIKLASSSANALTNTPINLTTNGNGTPILEIGIPYRRARTYVAGSQVKSADLDAKMDSFAALHALLTGQPQTLWVDRRPAPVLQIHQNWIVPMYASWTNTSSLGTIAKSVTSTRSGPQLQLTVTNNNDIAGVEIPDGVTAGVPSDCLGVIECSVDSTDIAGVTDRTFELGLYFSSGPTQYIALRKTNASANWTLVTQAATVANSGVVATGIQRFRIEIYGSNAAGGARVLLYIDDALVVSTANMPSTAVASRLYVNLRNGAAVGSSAKNVYVAPLTFTLRRL